MNTDSPVTDGSPGRSTAPRSWLAPGIAVGTLALLALVIGLYARQAGRANRVAPADAPKPVSVAPARGGSWRAERSYVGTIAPWTAARVGPQYVSAYVGTVLVRPGSLVRRGEVLATLDCRGSSAESRAISARARALEEREDALAHEAKRIEELQGGGFASTNEVEQMKARSKSGAAEVESLRASLVTKTLEVGDCILRAPFAGEVADRFVDPGAYVRPGGAVARIIDRSTVRVIADVPEYDFAVVAPGAPVTLVIEATGAKARAAVSRRGPAADETTRTVHVEIDVPNLDHALPVGTTVRIALAVGDARPASEIPLRAATVRGGKASLFVVEGGRAHRRTAPVLGEKGDTLFVDRSLPPGSEVVIEGRALLEEGDKVTAREETP